MTRVHVTVTVDGTPAPQGSKTAVVRGGRAVVIEGKGNKGRKAHKAWRTAVHEAATRAATTRDAEPLGDGTPLLIAAGFAVPRPKSALKRWLWSHRKPDVDKLLRSTLDGLESGGLIVGDSRVAAVIAWKRYALDGRPGAWVRVLELAETDELAVNLHRLDGPALLVASAPAHGWR